MVSKKRDDGEGGREMKYGGAVGTRFDKRRNLIFLRVSSISFPWLRKGTGNEDGISSFKTTFSTTLLDSFFFLSFAEPPLKT